VSDKIEWKPGDIGKSIKSPDIISLALVPIIALQKAGHLPDDIPLINPVSLYSGKGKCVEIFNNIVDHKKVAKRNGTSVEIVDPKIKECTCNNEGYPPII
jgi:hypothetical protein